MRGRKPKPPEIHEASGAYAKDPQRRNASAPMADGKMPIMPDYFTDDERGKWEEIINDLKNNGILSADTREILIAYCTAFGGWIKARRMVEKVGIVLASDGEIKRNPICVEMHKYREDMNRLLPELGLTPSARARLHVKKEEEPSAFTEFLNRRLGNNN